MTNQSSIDVGPMEGVAEGVVPTPATEALRIFMAQHVHDQTIGTNATATAAAASRCRHLCANGAMEQSCRRRQLQHPSTPESPLPTSEPLDMSDLTRATARVERRALRKKRSASTASRDENADDDFPAIQWNSDDDDDEDDSDEDTYAINDNEPSHQDQEDSESLHGTATVSSGVEIQGILKDDGDSFSTERANKHSGKAIAEEVNQASPNEKTLRKRRSGDALGMQACADTLQRAKSRKMCLPGCLGQKDTDSTNEECGCLMATSTPTRPTTSSTRPKKSLLTDSFMENVANQSNRHAWSVSPLQTASIPSSITSISPSSIAQKPATAAFLAATLERLATSEDFTNLSPLPPSRATSWGQFVSADNLSPLPSPPSHHYNSSLMKRKGSITSRSHTGLELKKAGSFCNVIAFQRGSKGLSSSNGSKRNNSFCPNYKGNMTTTTTTMVVPSPRSSPLNTTTSSF